MSPQTRSQLKSSPAGLQGDLFCDRLEPFFVTIVSIITGEFRGRICYLDPFSEKEKKDLFMSIFKALVTLAFLLPTISQASVLKDQLTLFPWCYATNSGGNFEKWELNLNGQTDLRVMRINGVAVDQRYSGTWELSESGQLTILTQRGTLTLQIDRLQGANLEFTNNTRAYTCF